MLSLSPCSSCSLLISLCSSCSLLPLSSAARLTPPAQTACGQSGIGRDTVQRYIEEGAKVLFCGRGEGAGEAIAEQYGENCVFMQADVMVEAEIEAVIEKAVELWGKLDVLFNNAGGGGGLPSVTKVTQQDIHRLFALNFDSMCYGIKYAVPHMKKQRTASIINNTSIAAHRAKGQRSSLCGSRCGMCV